MKQMMNQYSKEMKNTKKFEFLCVDVKWKYILQAQPLGDI